MFWSDKLSYIYTFQSVLNHSGRNTRSVYFKVTIQQYTNTQYININIYPHYF